MPEPVERSKYGNPESYEVFGIRYDVLQDPTGFKERGHASWYGKKFHGRRTSSGEVYDMFAMTAAHPLLRYRTGPGPAGNAAIFDGEPPPQVQALGQRMRPSLVDLFVALTRKPELDRQHF